MRWFLVLGMSVVCAFLPRVMGSGVLHTPSKSSKHHKRNDSNRKQKVTRTSIDGTDVLIVPRSRLRIDARVCREKVLLRTARKWYGKRALTVSTGGFFDPTSGVPVSYSLIDQHYHAKTSCHPDRSLVVLSHRGRKISVVTNWQQIRRRWPTEAKLKKAHVEIFECGVTLVPYCQGGFTQAWCDKPRPRYAIGLRNDTVVLLYHNNCRVALLKEVARKLHLTWAALLDGGDSVRASKYLLIWQVV